LWVEKMPLSIKHVTEVVVNTLRMRLDRHSGHKRHLRLRDELRAIRERCAKLPVLDNRTPDEILGYDERGLSRGH
jgi:antitoxin VapB